MSDKPPALRAAVTDLERALAGQPAKSASEPPETTQPSEEAVGDPADPPH